MATTATYTKLEPMRVIEWRTDDDRHVRVEFAETEAGVIVHQTFDAETAPSVDEQRQDWQGVLDNFARHVTAVRSEEQTSGLQSLMRISYTVFRLQKKTTTQTKQHQKQTR